MNLSQQSRRRWVWPLVVSLGLLFIVNGCALFEDEQTAKGKKIYRHYCMHCHGESGRQGEGFNWDSLSNMEFPPPKDLSDSSMGDSISDEDIFNAISRDMKDTTDQKVVDDVDYFGVATMPTFKYTLSEMEVWTLVRYVRSLHGGDFTFDVEGRRQQLESELESATQVLETASQALEAAEAKRDAEVEAAEEAAEAAGDEDFEAEEIELPEEEVATQAAIKQNEAKLAFERFAKRPKMTVARPDLTVSDEERVTLEETGKHLYFNKYGCNSCHSIAGEGGLVGPVLDRAGFRLNATWVYKWLMYPQGIKKHTKMPNLGFNDQDARAVTAYLETLRAPKPDKSIAPVVSEE
ncbi:c-type cytochrome [Nitrospira sp. M1]